jgi:hypothetical protein
MRSSKWMLFAFGSVCIRRKRQALFAAAFIGLVGSPQQPAELAAWQPASATLVASIRPPGIAVTPAREYARLLRHPAEHHLAEYLVAMCRAGSLQCASDP